MLAAVTVPLGPLHPWACAWAPVVDGTGWTPCSSWDGGPRLLGSCRPAVGFADGNSLGWVFLVLSPSLCFSQSLSFFFSVCMSCSFPLSLSLLPSSSSTSIPLSFLSLSFSVNPSVLLPVLFCCPSVLLPIAIFLSASHCPTSHSSYLPEPHLLLPISTFFSSSLPCSPSHSFSLCPPPCSFFLSPSLFPLLSFLLLPYMFFSAFLRATPCFCLSTPLSCSPSLFASLCPPPNPCFFLYLSVLLLPVPIFSCMFLSCSLSLSFSLSHCLSHCFLLYPSVQPAVPFFPHSLSCSPALLFILPLLPCNPSLQELTIPHRPDECWLPQGCRH